MGELAAPRHTVDIGEMLRLAVERQVPVESLEKLVDLHERIEAREAERMFNAAFARFQSIAPKPEKSTRAKIVSKRTGATHSWMYSDLVDLERAIGPALRKNGFSYTWDEHMEGDNLKRIECHLSHVGGHSIVRGVTVPIEQSGSMTVQHAHASAVTVGRRNSLILVCGLTCYDSDPDAMPEEAEPITPEQVNQLDDLIVEVGADKQKYLRYLNVKALSDVSQSQFAAAIAALQRKRKTVCHQRNGTDSVCS
jgi:hypothetical protein